MDRRWARWTAALGAAVSLSLAGPAWALCQSTTNFPVADVDSTDLTISPATYATSLTFDPTALCHSHTATVINCTIWVSTTGSSAFTAVKVITTSGTGSFLLGSVTFTGMTIDAVRINTNPTADQAQTYHSLQYVTLSSTDTDGDADCDDQDSDDDNDGVNDPSDNAPLNPDLCRDVEFTTSGDGCDDCSVGTDNFGSQSDATPLNDGFDYDGDGLCDAGSPASSTDGDPDDDNDGSLDANDSADNNRDVCSDTDGDGCEDCSDYSDNNTTLWTSTYDVFDDGANHDPDTYCDDFDTDDDNDSVADSADTADFDRNKCRDVDADGCDDCFDFSGNNPNGATDNVADDGADFDVDGLCNDGDPLISGDGDPDDDNDGSLDTVDNFDLDRTKCRDSDIDTCDDCTAYSQVSGHETGATFHPEADGTDFDTDGLCDAGDTCTDTDTDGKGNPGYAANTCALDNCPTVSNPGQANIDSDADGDVCDTCSDQDSDGFGNPGLNITTCAETGGDCTSAVDPDCAQYADNCPGDSNADQDDLDDDGEGDACDLCSDPDLDGYGSPGLPISSCGGSTSLVDNCPDDANSTQADLDDDDEGDACDTCTDDDDDGFGNPGFPATTCTLDNCPSIANPSQANQDADSTGDVCDACTDADADGYAEPTFQNSACQGSGFDNCPSIANPTQADFDADGLGDLCDLDDDDDGVSDAEEAVLGTSPLDTDSDDDTILDSDEMTSTSDPEDTDGDLTIDALDTDSDGDGASDAAEAGDTDLDTVPVDTDDDGTPDYQDTESDGDGVLDVDDNCRAVANDQADFDGDGQGDACDDDDDDDLVADTLDNCDFTSNEDQGDRDSDGEGDACEIATQHLAGPGLCATGPGGASWVVLVVTACLARRRRDAGPRGPVRGDERRSGDLA